MSTSTTSPMPTNTTIVNNKSKSTSQNEERLERRMTGLYLTTDTKSPMYQEHVCTEDFYKQPREVYENVIVMAKSIVETQVLGNGKAEGGGMNEDGAGRRSSSWRFESEVLWNDGGRSGYYENTGGNLRVENEGVQVSTASAKVESQIVGRPRQEEVLQNVRFNSRVETSIGDSNQGTREREEGSKSRRGQDTTILASQRDQNNPATGKGQRSTTTQPLPEERVRNLATVESSLQGNTRKPISPEAHGNRVRKKLESDSGGWKFAFELFELGKVPDSQSFLIDVLEEFVNRRPQYWKRIQKQGFDVEAYRKSDDDDLFLQLSYTNSALEMLQKGDTKRAMELILKCWPVIRRRGERPGSPITYIESIELSILIMYISMKGSKPPPLKSANEPDNFLQLFDLGSEFKSIVTLRTPIGLKWLFQFHFLMTMLLELDQRYLHANTWTNWLATMKSGREVERKLVEIVKEMHGVEALRYATEGATTGSKSEWSKRQGVRGLRDVSAGYLSRLASVGHKEVILLNLETLYDLKTIVGWDGRTFTSPTDTSLNQPNSPRYHTPPQVLPQSLAGPSSERYPGQQASGPVEVLRNKGKSPLPAPPRRQGSIRHPSPWESGLSSSSNPSSQSQPRRFSDRSTPERSTSRSPTGPLFSPRFQNASYNPEDWAISPSENTTTPSIPPEPRYSPPRTQPKILSAEGINLKSQRLANFRDQPVRHADDCRIEELNAITDYKQAIRHSQNLDVYIGTLASLHLINFISGNPEYRPWTPLIEAVCNQRWEAAKALIRLGASFDAGYPFHTALSRHFMAGSRSLCEKLVGRKLLNTGGLSADTYFFNESSGVIYYMIEAGANIDDVGIANTDLASQIKTYPIHLAALDTVPDSSLVWRLLAMGVDVWSMDGNGELAIDYARRAGNENTIKVLEDAMTE
ncbi:uncharacterized protein DFL_002055 [Arthrobotrys flagrans]|uniref:Uncharacterized protein n=1 Tax=Arthrobotrys flagrans TaxID=97331 RepID=A0A437A9T2_ARTFL|nr:hypothetical protein DFL_002055 [Arthrobotrys flagrans]